MAGSVGILNVGAGDTKLVFDKDSPQDCIRAARIVKDMLRRGYALLVEVEAPDGSKKFQRAYDFIENKYEYVIADLDPLVGSMPVTESEGEQDESAGEAASSPRPAQGTKARKRPRTKTVSATETRVFAVARSAGG